MRSLTTSVPSKCVSREQLGHSSATLALDRYGHVDTAMREGATAGCRTANVRKNPTHQSRFPRISDFLVTFSEPNAPETLLGQMDSNHRMQDSKSR